MVDLPSVPRRLVTTQAAESRISPQDIASPFQMLGEAMESFVPGVDAVAEKVGARAGAEKAVVMGEDGLPTITQMPMLSGPYGAAYNRAAQFAYTAKLANSIDERVFKAKQEFANNPAGFEGWQKGFISEIVKREKDPILRATVEKMVTGATGEAFRAVSADAQRVAIAGAKAALAARRTALDNRMAALARNGGTDTPEYRQALADYEAIGREAVSNPALGISREAIDADRKGMEARHTAEAVIGAKIRRGGAINPDPASVTDRIIGAETGGEKDPATAKNPNSSATGPGQFLDSTWLATIKRYKPDLAAGKTDAELLELRKDAGLSREMTDRLRQENSEALTASGHTASAGNVYLAHFLGSRGAIAMLEAGPNTPVRDALIKGGYPPALADKAIAANASVLQGKTAGQVVGWARGKMGDANDDSSVIEDTIWSPELDLSPEERRRYASWVHQEVNRADAERTKRSGVAAEAHERTIIDAAAGKTPPPPRSAIETDPTLTEASRNTLLRQYDSAMADVIKTNRAYDRFQSGGSFNPFDADDRKALDGIWARLGGDTGALKTVVDKTGMAPPSVVKTLRGDLISTDPKKIASGLTLAATLTTNHPSVFAGQDGGDDIGKAAATFRHYIDDLGYTADQAAARMALANTPEHKKAIAAKVAGEDIDEIVKKNLDVGDLRTAFDAPGIAGWWPGRPDLGANPEMRKSMFVDYAELFRDRYMENGNVNEAKAQAIAQLKRVWGVSRVNGSDVIMRYPPERVFGMDKLQDPSGAIQADAIASIEAAGFGKVDPAGLRFFAIPGRTAEAHKGGQKTPYILGWQDGDGLYHTIGRDFEVDPALLKARQTEERKAAFDEGRKASQSGAGGAAAFGSAEWEAGRQRVIRENSRPTDDSKAAAGRRYNRKPEPEPEPSGAAPAAQRFGSPEWAAGRQKLIDEQPKTPAPRPARVGGGKPKK